MAIEYKTIKQREGKIKHLLEQGYSHCEMGEELGCIKEQIKEFLHIERRQIRKQSERTPQCNSRPQKYATKSVTEFGKENK